MEAHRSQEPGAQRTMDPIRVDWPEAPSYEVMMGNAGHADITLPNLKTVLSEDYEPLPPTGEGDALSYGSPISAVSLPHIDPGPHADATRRSVDMGIASPTDGQSVRSDDERGRQRSIVPTEEDVRLAAEALSGLSGPAFIRSPSDPTGQPISPSEKILVTQVNQGQASDEPLLQLFASKHPWVGGTINGSINGSMYVYNTTKHYSPRIVQYGARLVEQNVAGPVINTVGSVGRITGVEGGLRRYLDGRPESDIESGVGQRTSRADNGDAMEIDNDAAEHRDTSDELPAYRASKPPSYREEYSPAATDRVKQQQSLASQVFVLTSGLGVALSASSRQSLQYCLGTLGEGSRRVETCMTALGMVLAQYDQARDSWYQRNGGVAEKGERPQTPDQDAAARRLADVIKYHSDEIWNTLKNVTSYISNSAGAALPQNARTFVRSQVMSLPQRWHIVSQTEFGESETSRNAHRMIAFATEGLDMIKQISHVITATLESAERWLDRAGYRGDMTPAQQAYLNEKALERHSSDPRSES